MTKEEAKAYAEEHGCSERTAYRHNTDKINAERKEKPKYKYSTGKYV